MEWLKKILEANGLTEPEKVIEAAKKAIAEHYVPKADFNMKNDEVKRLTETVEERDQQLSELQKSVGNAEAMKKRITEITEKNKADEEAWTAERKQLVLQHTVDLALLEAGAHNPKTTKPLVDMTVISVTENGTLVGLSEQLEKLKEEHGYLFGDTEIGKRGKTPPDGSDKTPAGGKNPWSKEHYNLTEQGRLLRSDPEKARQLAKQAGITI